MNIGKLLMIKKRRSLNMRHCDDCGFLAVEGYEYPESYCSVGVQEEDPKFDEDDKGCGCHYNLRTLRKRKEENERAEYFCYLGYDDYFLMPTMEYTNENCKILEKHCELMRQAIGMDNRKTYIRHGRRFYKPHRNRYVTHDKASDYPYWERLVKAGLSVKNKDDSCIWYSVTRRGMDWLGQHDGIHIYNEKNT